MISDDLAEQVKADAGIEAWTRLGDAGDLAGTVLAHPWRGVAAAAGGYDFGVPVLAGDFVTTEQGTGFVHIAPGHGADDWAPGLKHAIENPHTVDGAGHFSHNVPLPAGPLVPPPNGQPGDPNST